MPEPPPVDDDVIEGEHVSTEPEVVEMPEVEEETWDADTAPQVGSPATELATPDALVGLDLKAYTKNTNLNEMVPALINRQADFTLLDVPDAILDLERWTGQIKVIGPISDHQDLAAAFPKASPQLRDQALLVERQVFTTEGEAIEFGKSLYRADRYRFEVNVGRAQPEDVGSR